NLLETRVGLQQGAGETHEDCAALARLPAAAHVYEDIPISLGVRRLERREAIGLGTFAEEVLLHFMTMNFKLAVTRTNADAGDRGLAPACAPEISPALLWGCGRGSCLLSQGNCSELSDLLQVEGLALLRVVRVILALVNLQLGQHPPAQ